MLLLLLAGVVQVWSSCSPPSRLHPTSPSSTGVAVTTAKQGSGKEGTAYVVVGYRVYALQETGGKLLWQQEMPEAINQIAATQEGVYLLSTTLDGQVYALNAKDGSIRWKEKLDVLPMHIEASGSTVYIGAEQGFYAVSAKIGKQVWHTAAAPPSEDIGFIGSEAGIIYSYCDGVIYALQERSGKIVWHRQRYYTVGDNILLQDGKLSLPNFQRSTITVLRTSDGAIEGTLQGYGIAGAHGMLYIVSTGKQQQSQEVYALRESSKQVVWKKQLPANEYWSLRLGMVGDRLLYLSGADRTLLQGAGTVHVFALDLRDGKQAWQWTSTEKPDIDFSTMQFHNGQFYTSARNSRLSYPVSEQTDVLALSSNNGSVTWRQSFDEMVLRIGFAE